MMHFECLNFVELSVVGEPWPPSWPYPAMLSLSLLHGVRGKMEKLRVKTEIIYQLPSQAKQWQQSPAKIHLGSEKQAQKD